MNKKELSLSKEANCSNPNLFGKEFSPSPPKLGDNINITNINSHHAYSQNYSNNTHINSTNYLNKNNFTNPSVLINLSNKTLHTNTNTNTNTNMYNSSASKLI
jgi:hypothetical protein